MDDFNYDNEIIEVSDEVETLEDVIKKEVEGVEPPKSNKNKKRRKINLTKKIHLTTIYLLEGETDEKK